MKIYIFSSEENIFASWHVSLYADAYKNHLIYMHNFNIIKLFLTRNYVIYFNFKYPLYFNLQTKHAM